MEVYDERKIGKILSWKGENLVRRYGESEVIKFSKLGWVFRRAFKDRLEQDIKIAESFFGDRMVPARVATSASGSRKALIQPFVVGRILRKSDLRDTGIREQYLDMMRRHDAMLAAGYSPLDLAGGFGLLRGRLDNLFLLQDGTLKIIDTLLIDIQGLNNYMGKFLLPAVALVVWRQKRIVDALLH